jgi:hypothetical protein
MNEYIFPFSTCEKPTTDGYIAQPYSAFFNVINCLIILYFLVQTKNHYTFILLFSILCFEAFHVFSHTMHLQSSIQFQITHFLTYIMNIVFLYVFINYTKEIPNYTFSCILFLLICFDIYSIMNLSIIFYLVSQFTIFITILFYYYPLLPKNIQRSIYWIVFIATMIVFLFWNEIQNCEKMLEIYPHFPYHIFIEIFGIFMFYIICSNFYDLPVK